MSSYLRQSIKWLQSLMRIGRRAAEQPEVKRAPERSLEGDDPRPAPDLFDAFPAPRQREPVIVRGRAYFNTAEAARRCPQGQAIDGGMGVECLITRLADRSRAEARRSATEALRQLGPEANAAIPALLLSLVDADATVRQAAVKALSAMDPDWKMNEAVQKAVLFWVTALKNGSQEVSESAAKLLAQAGSRAVSGLAQVLSEGGDVIENVLVLRVLRQIGPDSASVVPEMTHALGSQFAQVRIAAAHALASAGHAAAPAAPALTLGLIDWNADVRQAMACCLAKVGPAAGLAGLGVL